MRVRRATARHIGIGNSARQRQDWAVAARAYRDALAGEPHLQHLWVQLGHVEKEAGAIDRAADAYAEAARLRPDDPEPLIHLGHMAKAWRQPIEAARHFVGALQRDRANLQAVSELVRLMPDCDDVDPDLWRAVLDVLDIDPNESVAQDTGHLLPRSTVLDVTDLLAFFGQRRLPTGIQRLQIEVSLACLDAAFGPPPVFCVYASARRGWVRLPHDRFDALCRLARQSDDVDDPAWVAQLDRMYRGIAIGRTLRFAPGTVLVNLGTSWADRNYLLDVRIVRARDAVVYVPLVFDLIPLIGAHWFMQSLVRDYRAWFGSLLHSADGFVAISQATREDLVRTSAEWHAPVPAAAVPVVRLDGDFRQDPADASALDAYGLRPEGYVLLVSTLEPRKNHLGAFRAWRALAATLGEGAVPRLVCVGGRGWLNEDLHRMLRDDPLLQRLVLILHGVPDDALAAMYEHCLFALYPSFYEGWGLPVSEALSYGKVPAISRSSSLPEAGGPHARYYDPHDPDDIAATVRTLLDPATRCEAEAAIGRDYAPRTWHAIARELVAKARQVAPRVADTLPRLEGAGTWTLALPDQRDGADVASGARQGEALRHGRGWLSPGLSGCRIEGDDAALWFHWAGLPDSELHIHFAATDEPASVTIAVEGVSRTYDARPHGPLVVACPLPATTGPVRIAILPTAGEVVVEKVVVVRA